MRKRGLSLGLALALGGLVSCAGQVAACTCVDPPPALVALCRADAVFAGVVVGVRDPNGAPDADGSAKPVHYTIRVEDVWKGDVGDTVVVRTARLASLCGYPFRGDDAYLIYARRDSVGLTTNLCTRTNLLERASDDLALFAGGDLSGSSDEVDGRIVQAELERLASEDQEIRIEAVDALERMGRRPDLAIPVLANLYQNGTTSDRLAAVSAIGSLGCGSEHAKDVVPILLGALHDTSCGVRLSAIYALSRMQSEAGSITPILQNVLYDPNPTVRRHAAAALAILNSTGPGE
jgi:hypothetical protein